MDTLTYGTLWAGACQVSASLRAQGVGQGDVVIIVLPHSTALYTCFLGAMAAGAIPSFMPPPSAKQDPDYYWSTHAQLFARIGVRVLITYPDLAAEITDRIADRTFTVVAEDALRSEPSATVAATVQCAASEIAFLQHSSGTTGLKKGVMLSHQAVLTQTRNYAANIGFCDRDIIASWLPLYHDMGLISCFMMPMIVCATVVAVDPFEWVVRPKMLLNVIQQYGATFCWMPNFAFQHIPMSVRPAEHWDLSSMRAFINCSEPCKAQSFQMFRDRFASEGLRHGSLQVCYAMAENVFAVTQTPPGAAERVLHIRRDILEQQHRAVVAAEGADTMPMLSCGHPIEGCHVMILDDADQPLPAGAVGQIAVSGTSLFTGYFRQSDLTDQKLRNGIYRTGDLGFLHDGELFVTGRLDDLLIVYGRNFYAHEIDAVAGSVEGIVPGRVVAFAVESARSGTRDVIVLVEKHADAESSTVKRGVKDAVQARMTFAPFAVEVMPTGWLAKSTSGKISRDLNRTRYQNQDLGWNKNG